MNAHDQMRTKFREEIVQLCRQYSHGDTSPRARLVLAQIETLETARLMWGVTWWRYGEVNEKVALNNFIFGVDYTIRSGALLSKGVLTGWRTAREFAEETLALLSR